MDAISANNAPLLAPSYIDKDPSKENINYGAYALSVIAIVGGVIAGAAIGMIIAGPPGAVIFACIGLITGIVLTILFNTIAQCYISGLIEDEFEANVQIARDQESKEVRKDNPKHYHYDDTQSDLLSVGKRISIGTSRRVSNTLQTYTVTHPYNPCFLNIVIDAELKEDLFDSNYDAYFKGLLKNTRSTIPQTIITLLQLTRSYLLERGYKANLITLVIDDQLWIANESCSRVIATNNGAAVQRSVNSSQEEINSPGPSKGMTNRITHCNLDNKVPEYLIIGSKSLFDWASSQEVVDIVHHMGRTGSSCSDISHELAASTEAPSAVVVVRISPPGEHPDPRRRRRAAPPSL